MAWIAILTRDVMVGPVPFKVLLVAGALIAWGLSGADLRRRVFRAPLVVPVMLVAVIVPLAWGLLGVTSSGGPVTSSSRADAVAEASRFVYLLLYFPLAAVLPRGLSRGHVLWLGPAAVLVVVTWALWGMLAFGSPSWANSTQAYAFAGVFGEQGGFPRVSIGNQVVIVAAFAFVAARLLTDVDRRGRTALAGVVLLSALFHAHARGLLLATVAAAIVVTTPLVLGGRRPSRTGVRVGVVATIVVFVGAIALVARVGIPGFADASSQTRVGQSTALIDAWKAAPVLGHGLGAALADGLVRSSDAPWSFELTYLQLLMQVGVLGTLIVVVGLGYPAIRGFRVGWIRGDAAGRSAAVGAACVVTVLVATATNPYLLSAYGMLVVAIGFALIDHGLAPAAAEREASKRGDVRLGGGVILVTVVLLAFELVVPRQAALPSGTDFSLPRPPAAADGSDVAWSASAADLDAPASKLWLIGRSPRAQIAYVAEVSPHAGPGRAASAAWRGVMLRSRSSALAVTRLRGRTVLLEATTARDDAGAIRSIRLTAHPLDGDRNEVRTTTRKLRRAFKPVGPVTFVADPPGTRRSARLALVLQDASTRRTLRVPLDGGLPQQLPNNLLFGTTPWLVAAATYPRRPADLLFVLRGRSTTGAELHQLDGRVGLRSFREERVLTVAPVSKRTVFAPAIVGGRTGLFLVDVPDGRSTFYPVR